MDARHALLQRLGEIAAAIDHLDPEEFADRYQLQRAADQLRSTLSGLDDAGHVTSEWAEQAVRTLEETEFAVPTVNIDTRKEPGL